MKVKTEWVIVAGMVLSAAFSLFALLATGLSWSW